MPLQRIRRYHYFKLVLKNVVGMTMYKMISYSVTDAIFLLLFIILDRKQVCVGCSLDNHRYVL